MGFFCLHATFICGSCWPNVCRGGVGCPDGPCHGRPGVTNSAREECDERKLLKLVLVPAEVGVVMQKACAWNCNCSYFSECYVVRQLQKQMVPQ